MRAGTVGHAQAGAQVVRIGHAVEHQQQRLLDAVGLQLFEQLVERMDLRDGFHAGGHALVPVAAGELGDAQRIGFDEARSRLLRALEELAHARVAPRGLVVDLDDGLRRGLQAHAHGVEAE